MSCLLALTSGSSCSCSPALLRMALLWAAAVSAVSTTQHSLAAETDARVTQGLQALYTFEAAADGVVRDQSGADEPLHLRMDKPQLAGWQAGRLLVNSSLTIASDGPARRLTAAVQQSQELSLEVWLQPLMMQQTGPARILSLSLDPSQRNFTLGQDQGRFDVRLRTTATSSNGQPSTATPENSVTARRTHVVFTRAVDGTARILINGQTVVTQMVAGDFSNWDGNCRLVLANEATGDRPWLGELQLVAVYSRALTVDEVQQNYRAGVPQSVDYAVLLPPAHTGPVDFVRDIQPILRQHCYDCHAADQEDGGLSLGQRRRALQGGDHGAVLLAGDSTHSRLIHLVAAVDGKHVMPPDSQGLSAQEVGLLRAWIDQGLIWPDGTDVPDPRVEQARGHWAYQPLQAVPEPAVQNNAWVQTPVDRFILSRLEAAGLTPQSPATPRQLLRRLTFDLTGLPPAPAEVDAFCAAADTDRAQAVTAVVDQLLQSPHYGERWGRHWLDVARYADSDGQESDRDRPTAYHYRDFVIRAFNEDRPFDEFIRWQLAGDEYAPADPQAMAATGFLAAGPFAALPDRLMEDERLRNRYNELDDLLSTIGTGFLGLTLGCVRCHDHKYDAIPARDYYSLLSAFHSGERGEVPLGATSEKVLGWRDLGRDPGPTWLFQRGNYYDRDQPVSLGFVSILTSGRAPEDYWQTARAQSPAVNSSGQRRALAEWMTDVQQGAGALLARVIVNRIWLHHFGQGLVRTVGDFGVRSEPPSHPELLEWLAHDLVTHGWRIKRLQRLILQSAVYQQASTGTPPAADPDNRLLWRMPLQRLEAEVLRDALLAVSGTLNRTVYGPAVKPPIAAEAMLARNLKDAYPDKIQDSPELRRRSIYLFHKRVVPYPLLQAFDKPDAQQSCSRRDRTTVAPQALALLNDPFVRTVATEFADRLLREHPQDAAGQVVRGYRLALARAPADTELVAAVEFLDLQQMHRRGRAADAGDSELQRQALADFCQVLFSLNEFLYVD